MKQKVNKRTGPANDSLFVTDAARKVARASGAAFNPGRAVSCFGGQASFEKLLRSIDNIDRKNQSAAAGQAVTGDLFYIIPDSLPSYNAARFTRLAEKWETGQRPSLPAIAAAWLDRLGMTECTDNHSLQGRRINALLLLAARAERVGGEAPAGAAPQANEPAYHNRTHFLHVLQATGHLIEQNEEMLSRDIPGAVDLTAAQKTLLLIAALAHDLDHPGRGNRTCEKTGDPVLFQNEEKSFAAADGIFNACGLPADERAAILTMLRVTDPQGPHQILKSIMAGHEAGTPMTLETIALGHAPRYKPLAPLLTDKTLCYMAAILSDADLHGSAGAGLSTCLANSRKLSAELRAADMGDTDFTLPQNRIKFLTLVVGEKGFTSAAGRAAFNESFFDLLRLTRSELESKRTVDKTRTADLKHTPPGG